jgi:hypothetical protein
MLNHHSRGVELMASRHVTYRVLFICNLARTNGESPHNNLSHFKMEQEDCVSFVAMRYGSTTNPDGE